MSSRRVYRRRDYIPRMYSKAVKYQYVPFSVQANFTSDDVSFRQVIVPTSTVAGIRKCKNFNINFVTNASSPLIFAIIYVPEGANPSQLTPVINTVTDGTTFSELFAANQWVIGCGSIVAGAVNNWRTRMSRNLNNGDSVYLFMWNIGPAEALSLNATGNYAIRYN